MDSLVSLRTNILFLPVSPLRDSNQGIYQSLEIRIHGAFFLSSDFILPQSLRKMVDDLAETMEKKVKVGHKSQLTPQTCLVTRGASFKASMQTLITCKGKTRWAKKI